MTEKNISGKKICSLKKILFYFWLEEVTVEELFAYIFGIYIKFGYKNPSVLTPYDSVDFAT